MVTHGQERRQTECELVTYGGPGGGAGVMGLYERRAMCRMPGTNGQISTTTGDPSNASLIHFPLTKEISQE